MKIIYVAVIAALLGGCLGTKTETGANPAAVTEVQKAAKAVCGIVPLGADVAAVLGVPGAPVGKLLAQLICDQYLAKKRTNALFWSGNECVAVINGVCIRAEDPTPPEGE